MRSGPAGKLGCGTDLENEREWDIKSTARFWQAHQKKERMAWLTVLGPVKAKD